MSDYRYDEEYSVEYDLVTGTSVIYDEYTNAIGTIDSCVEDGDYYGDELTRIESDLAAKNAQSGSNQSSVSSSNSDSYNTSDNNSSSRNDADASFSVLMIGGVPILLTLLVFQGDGGALLFVGPIFAIILIGIMTVLMSIGSSIADSVKKS